ncbi:hypothetical protein BD626DRAFT_506565 [Schizophyllum amplum]|uniref:Uncharacterized protein n=1 Tax=Schizophyllum amplum TaxID=97359 RepID=A0A550C4X1_9AGAR|nr:hypothetical protein BD626DRAFT_506565 [Auriculariopsis ampla]
MSTSQNQAVQLLASPLPALAAVTHTLPPPAALARAVGSRHSTRARRRNACVPRLRTGSSSQLARARGPMCAPESARCHCHAPRCLAARSCNWAPAHIQPARTAPTCARAPPIRSIMHVLAPQPAHRVCTAYAPRCTSRMRAHPALRFLPTHAQKDARRCVGQRPAATVVTTMTGTAPRQLSSP